MKTQVYLMADLPPPLGKISQSASDGVNWGVSVGLGIFGILMALSIVAYLFKK